MSEELTRESSPEPVTVWLHPALLSRFESWLSLNDLHLYGPLTFPAEERPESGYMVGIGPGPRVTHA